MNRAARRRDARQTARRRRTARAARRGTALAAGATLALSGTTGWSAATADPAGARVCGPQDVSSTADSGPGTLRDILAAAYDGDTITFNCVANQTITVSTPIAIGKFVTIDGGANVVTISGNNASGVFKLDPTRTGTGTVTMKNLTVSHGRVSDATAAGLEFACASTGIDLTLDGMTFDHHAPASGTTMNGAAVRVLNCGDVTVTGSDFLDNTNYNAGPLGFGAGMNVSNSGVVSISGSTFSRNLDGGALEVYNSTSASLTDTDFDLNARLQTGAALRVASTPLTVTRGQMTDNTASLGGAVSLYQVSGDTATFTGVVFSYNDATGNGGGALYVGGSGGSVTVSGSTFDHNMSLGGGAIEVGSDVTAVTVTGSTFSYNTASYLSGSVWTGNGGAIMSYADLTVTDSTFDHNAATADGGGAIAVLGSTTDLSITGSTFTDNSAAIGGAVVALDAIYYTAGLGSIAIQNSTFSGNDADYGGVIYTRVAATSIVIANSTLVSNTAWFGGAAYINGASPFSLLQSTVTGNSTTNCGGGLSLYGSGAMVISGSIVVGNTAALAICADDINGSASATVTPSLLGDVQGVTLTGTYTSGVALADLHLGALADNGGPTHTMALGAGSVAIDAGPDPVASFTGNTTDQRGTGFDRVVNGTVDVGAFEVQAASPPAPTGLNLTSLGGRTARLTWTAPASGPTPTGYQVRCLPQGTPVDVGPGGPVVYVGSTTTSVDIADLVGGTTYVCYVRARYGAQYFSWLGDSDEGPLSDPSNSLLVAATVPVAPGRVVASTPPQPSGQTTAVGFVAPENRSGAPVTRYDARCTSSNGGTTRTGTGASSPVGVGNLTKGRTYSCVVSAVNSVGPSAWSAASSRIVVPAGPVTDVRASTPTAANRRTTVTFTAPDGGPTPARYWVECRTADGSSVLTGTAVRSPVAVANLVRGRTYTCRVWAVFEGGVRGPVSTASNSIRVP